jgi:AraC-like DNA-binding protein
LQASPIESIMTGGAATFRFCTSELPERGRLAAWRESVGRDLLRFEMEPLDGAPLSFDMTARRWTGLRIISVTTSPVRTERTRALLADGDDNLCVLMPDAAGVFAGLGREVTIGAGEAIVMPRCEVASFVFPSTSQVLAAHVPRAAFEPVLRRSDAVLMRPIPAQCEALRLLGHLLSAMMNTVQPPDDLQRVSVNYVYDLLGLAASATADAAAPANGPGLPAVRLLAIKDDIFSHLHDSNLTLTAVARRHRISPRYVQMLFESEGTTFSHFVRNERLARVNRMLANPAYAASSISSIAFDAGFVDLSHFNRAFRRAYGKTPSDVRAAALGSRRG